EASTKRVHRALSQGEGFPMDRDPHPIHRGLYSHSGTLAARSTSAAPSRAVPRVCCLPSFQRRRASAEPPSTHPAAALPAVLTPSTAVVAPVLAPSTPVRAPISTSSAGPRRHVWEPPQPSIRQANAAARLEAKVGSVRRDSGLMAPMLLRRGGGLASGGAAPLEVHGRGSSTKRPERIEPIVGQGLITI